MTSRLRRPISAIHIPLTHAPFSRATILQDTLVRAFLDAKSDTTGTVYPPPPALITSEFNDHNYTLGRRESSLDPSTLNFPEGASIIPTLRGGQTTYHGPGQLTGYVIADINALRFSPRCWINMLEQSVIDTLLRFGLHGERVKEHPGVWVRPYGVVGMKGRAPEMRKICAVGVHLRRNVASFGIGFNVETDLKWFERITACGLPGDRTTSLKNEGVGGVNVGHVRKEWVRVMKDKLKVAKVAEVDWRDVMQMVSGDVSYREAIGGRSVY